MTGTIIILYLIITLGIGLWASRKVKNGNDFILAGGNLPLYISVAALFATWFGSETVLGASSEMAEKGLYGVIEDPFGASLCLILIGLFFAKPLYKLKLNTFGDFYGKRYSPGVELVASICLVFTYLGWIAGQMVAIGVVFQVIFDMPQWYGIVVGSIIVLLYTSLGGMWSVAVLDFIQMIVIIVGMVLVLVYLSSIKSIPDVLKETPDYYFEFFKHGGAILQINYIAMWITIGLGSIPQQDIFQRVLSSKSGNQAKTAAIISGFMYLTIALIPLLLALYAKNFSVVSQNNDSQLLVPSLIMKYTPEYVKIIFFGALLSAVMSTASGAMLAPATILSENIIGHFILKGKNINIIFYTRLSLLLIAVVSLFIALREGSIYELVSNSNALSLVGLFIPLVFGLFGKRASSQGAMLSIFAGLSGWLIAIILNTEINPLIYGLMSSLVVMLASLIIWRKHQGINAITDISI